MTEDADIGFSSKFQRGDGEDPEEFATVGEVVDVVPPKLSREAIDVTHSESPDGWQEFIGGLRQAEEFSVQIHYNASSAHMASVHADFAKTVPGNYKVIFPDGSDWTFAALVIGVSPATPTGDKMVCEITFRPSGKATVTVAA
ncbi:phage tail tube protein [Pseudooceanicola algae]|uniref:Lambda phage tail tube protein N-terminal domain-containing protein n=1 Tax=Pseudooceanicola algae TaxID=1537215 RepID=A0A418SDG0_9RHOB|nr:phage tail tube protein [Pseudooceanicola algae]QPM89382.1 hypothetical protein PSAL_005980 [Pseudooceanicola algae]